MSKDTNPTMAPSAKEKAKDKTVFDQEADAAAAEAAAREAMEQERKVIKTTVEELVTTVLDQIDAEEKALEAVCSCSIQKIMSVAQLSCMKPDTAAASMHFEAEPETTEVDAMARFRLGLVPQPPKRVVLDFSLVPEAPRSTRFRSSCRSLTEKTTQQLTSVFAVADEEEPVVRNSSSSLRDANESAEYRKLRLSCTQRRSSHLQKKAQLAVREAEARDADRRFEDMRDQLRGRDFTHDATGNVILTALPTAETLPKLKPGYFIRNMNDPRRRRRGGLRPPLQKRRPAVSAPLAIFEPNDGSFIAHDESLERFSRADLQPGVKVIDGGDVVVGPSLDPDPHHMSRKEYDSIASRTDRRRHLDDRYDEDENQREEEEAPSFFDTGATVHTAPPLLVPRNASKKKKKRTKDRCIVADDMSELSMADVVVDPLRGSRVVPPHCDSVVEDDDAHLRVPASVDGEHAPPRAPTVPRLPKPYRFHNTHRILKTTTQTGPRIRNMARTKVEADLASYRVARVPGRRRLRPLPPVAPKVLLSSGGGPGTALPQISCT